MKIAFPTRGENLTAVINDNFARSDKFLIIDSETKEFEVFNNAAAASQGGAGPKAAQILIDKGVEVLIAPRCGQKAYDLLSAGEIKVYKASGISIEEGFNLYTENKLSELNEVHSGFHNHG